jgi:hypothetical protein
VILSKSKDADEAYWKYAKYFGFVTGKERIGYGHRREHLLAARTRSGKMRISNVCNEDSVHALNRTAENVPKVRSR